MTKLIFLKELLILLWAREAAQGNWQVEDVTFPQAPSTAAHNFSVAAAAARRSFVFHL